jgi:hypothetical protein
MAQDITPELALYVVTYYPQFMTVTERVANRHLAATFKATGGRADATAQAEARHMSPRSRWISSDPAVLRLSADGADAFRARVALRILRAHREQVFLNFCPRCGELTQTPKARLCLHCGYDWHNVAAE